jgi:hypothetical protein
MAVSFALLILIFVLMFAAVALCGLVVLIIKRPAIGAIVGVAFLAIIGLGLLSLGFLRMTYVPQAHHEVTVTSPMIPEQFAISEPIMMHEGEQWSGHTETKWRIAFFPILLCVGLVLTLIVAGVARLFNRSKDEDTPQRNHGKWGVALAVLAIVAIPVLLMGGYSTQRVVHSTSGVNHYPNVHALEHDFSVSHGGVPETVVTIQPPSAPNAPAFDATANRTAGSSQSRKDS